ncbi:hypothetical protein L3X38_002092 [Prunus dulcis]|uniref:Uncharacterized protein n=1 Tax=Prunus dulcis TaxID=3755 RepID=A0AAD4WT97_PRUDU|nr:hypothetical protein L3X38_002092 [Prunus dulcis]
MPEFRFFVLTMAENFFTMILTSSYKIMASYIKAHALTLPNRIGWLKERTDTYWKLFVPFSLVPICHDHFRAKLLSHPRIGSAVARYCPLWAPLSARTVLFLGAHEQLPSGSPILGLLQPPTRLTSEFLRLRSQ